MKSYIKLLAIILSMSTPVCGQTYTTFYQGPNYVGGSYVVPVVTKTYTDHSVSLPQQRSSYSFGSGSSLGNSGSYSSGGGGKVPGYIRRMNRLEAKRLKAEAAAWREAHKGDEQAAREEYSRQIDERINREFNDTYIRNFFKAIKSFEQCDYDSASAYMLQSLSASKWDARNKPLTDNNGNELLSNDLRNYYLRLIASRSTDQYIYFHAMNAIGDYGESRAHDSIARYVAYETANTSPEFMDVKLTLSALEWLGRRRDYTESGQLIAKLPKVFFDSIESDPDLKLDYALALTSLHYYTDAIRELNELVMANKNIYATHLFAKQLAFVLTIDKAHDTGMARYCCDLLKSVVDYEVAHANTLTPKGLEALMLQGRVAAYYHLYMPGNEDLLPKEYRWIPVVVYKEDATQPIDQALFYISCGQYNDYLGEIKAFVADKAKAHMVLCFDDAIYNYNVRMEHGELSRLHEPNLGGVADHLEKNGLYQEAAQLLDILVKSIDEAQPWEYYDGMTPIVMKYANENEKQHKRNGKQKWEEQKEKMTARIAKLQAMKDLH